MLHLLCFSHRTLVPLTSQLGTIDCRGQQEPPLAWSVEVSFSLCVCRFGLVWNFACFPPAGNRKRHACCATPCRTAPNTLEKNHSCMASPRCCRLQGERGGHKVPRVRRAVKAAALRGQRQATGGRSNITIARAWDHLGSMVRFSS